MLSSQQEAELQQLTVQLTELNKLRSKQSTAIQEAERDRDIMTSESAPTPGRAPSIFFNC